MKIAIIAGCGNFPIQIARQNKDAFVMCIEGYSNQNLFENKSETVSLLELVLLLMAMLFHLHQLWVVEDILVV